MTVSNIKSRSATLMNVWKTQWLSIVHRWNKSIACHPSHWHIWIIYQYWNCCWLWWPYDSVIGQTSLVTAVMVVAFTCVILQYWLKNCS